MEKSERNNKQDIEQAELRTNVKWLVKEVGDIKTNHLSSIYKSIKEIEKVLNQSQTWLMAGTFTIMSSTIVGLVIYSLTI